MSESAKKCPRCGITGNGFSCTDADCPVGSAVAAERERCARIAEFVGALVMPPAIDDRDIQAILRVMDKSRESTARAIAEVIRSGHLWQPRDAS